MFDYLELFRSPGFAPDITQHTNKHGLYIWVRWLCVVVNFVKKSSLWRHYRKVFNISCLSFREDFALRAEVILVGQNLEIEKFESSRFYHVFTLPYTQHVMSVYGFVWVWMCVNVRSFSEKAIHYLQPCYCQVKRLIFLRTVMNCWFNFKVLTDPRNSQHLSCSLNFRN